MKATDGLAAESSTVKDRVLATLTLDQEDQETVTAATFGRSTDPQPLTLVYRVSGCRVVDTLPLPRSPLPTGPVNTVGARALPLGSVQIDDVEADGDRYVVHLRVFVSSGKASDQGGTSKPSTDSTDAERRPGSGSAYGAASPRPPPPRRRRRRRRPMSSASTPVPTPASCASKASGCGPSPRR